VSAMRPMMMEVYRTSERQAPKIFPSLLKLNRLGGRCYRRGSKKWLVVADRPNRRRREPTCLRCSRAMVPVVHIHTFEDQPGLDAFECPKCGRVESRLSEVRRDRWRPRRP
jgi:hypothetical protein